MGLDKFAVQDAIYQRLKAMITDVPTFAHVPQNQAYPYIRIDAVDPSFAGTKAEKIWEFEIALSVYDKNVAGNKRLAGILKRIDAALHWQETALDTQTGDDSSIILEGFKVIELGFIDQIDFQQGTPDDHYYHGVQRYRAILQET